MFLKHKSKAVAALRGIVDTYFAPAGLKIGAVPAGNGGELEGTFHELLYDPDNQHVWAPLHTTQYNGITERKLRLLRDKTVALLRGMTEAARNRLWAHAFHYACATSNPCMTTSLD